VLAGTELRWTQLLISNLRAVADGHRRIAVSVIASVVAVAVLKPATRMRVNEGAALPATATG
jgi:hypothetical protein